MRPNDPSLRPLLLPARAALTGVVAAGVLGGALVVAQAFAVGTLLVRLVGQHADDWLTELRAAMASVEEGRGRGPRFG